MIQKLLSGLTANVRDVVLATVAAGAGVWISAGLPSSWEAVSALASAIIYAAARAAVAVIASKLSSE